MGLWVSHGAWTGAYSAFNRLRNAWAEAAGYSVMEHNHGHRTAVIDWDKITHEQLMGEWAETPADPLLVLIAHSDCEGVIHPAQAGPVADRLEALLSLLPGDDTAGGHIDRNGGYSGATRSFIDGLREAASAGENVEFG